MADYDFGGLAFEGDAAAEGSAEVSAGAYVGPTYEFTSSVTNFQRVPRFGHGSDFTLVVSPNADEQADYAAGLIAIFATLLAIFVFWILAIVTFKIMGPGNAGFLSGHHFVVPDPVEDEKNLYKRPRRVRTVFLIATALLMTFTFVFVAQGLTNVSSASVTMSTSLETTDELLVNAELIAVNLEKVGENSIQIRDAAVAELDNLCPADQNIGDAIGMDIVGIAAQAQSDLTMLANFIRDGLETLNENLELVRGFTDSANATIEVVDFWGWQMKLLAAGLFILPAFLAFGVGLVSMGMDSKRYQKCLTYFLMPLFTVVIICSCIVCCAMLPVSASSADACAGGGELRGGPDDTVLTIYRNLRGDDTSLLFQFVGFYTQQCNPEYYPFDFLGSYLNDLDEAVESTNTAVDAVRENQEMLEAQCGRRFDDVLDIVEDMNVNLKLLQEQVDLSLDLVKCESINELYVNTVHQAGCTYSVDALGWIFGSSLVISICGLIMIMLRASYYPAEYLELGDAWVKEPVPTKSASRDSAESTDPMLAKRAAHSAVPVAPRTPPRSIRVQQTHDDEFEASPERPGAF
ncbi:hypothetical protein ACHAXT_005228 [Thalassiosira profunda]